MADRMRGNLKAAVKLACLAFVYPVILAVKAAVIIQMPDTAE